VFPIGTTLVTCTATDGSSLTDLATLTVTVIEGPVTQTPPPARSTWSIPGRPSSWPRRTRQRCCGLPTKP
jgi:hypothetical protein